MRLGSLYVAGLGSSLGPIRAIGGLAPEDFGERTGQLSVAVAEEEDTAPDFAARAARDAMRESGYRGDQLAAVVHAVAYQGGLDLWTPATYIAHAVGAREAAHPIEIRVGCNPFLAWEIVSRYLRPGGPWGTPAALVTAADVWGRRPGVLERWQPGFALGDGGGAVVLSVERGFAQVESLVTGADHGLEGVHRGPDAIDGIERPIDLRERARNWEMPLHEFWGRRLAGVRRTVDRALTDAAIGLGDIALTIWPMISEELTRRYLEPLGLPIGTSTYEIGRDIGHLGAADPMVLLERVIDERRLRPGDRALLVSIGAGDTWSAAVVRLIHRPGSVG